MTKTVGDLYQKWLQDHASYSPFTPVFEVIKDNKSRLKNDSSFASDMDRKLKGLIGDEAHEKGIPFKLLNITESNNSIKLFNQLKLH